MPGVSGTGAPANMSADTRTYSLDSGARWCHEPAVTVLDSVPWALWLVYTEADDTCALQIGRCEGAAIRLQSVLRRHAATLLQPLVTVGAHGQLWVFWVEGDAFELHAAVYDTATSGIVHERIMSDGSTRCRNAAVTRDPQGGFWLTWEAWSSEAASAVHARHWSNAAGWSETACLTHVGEPAYWPSVCRNHEALWSSFCRPNASRTGYDCIVTVTDRNRALDADARQYCIHAGHPGAFHLYPHLAAAPTGEVWLTWIATTPHDYYALRDAIGNDRYTYLQDPDSRARRSIWWNAAVPEVRRLTLCADGGLCVERPAGTERDRLLWRFGHVHHPRLVFGENASARLVFRRYHRGSKAFRVESSTLGPKGWSEPVPLHDDTVTPRLNGRPALASEADSLCVALETCDVPGRTSFHTRPTAGSICVVTRDLRSPQQSDEPTFDREAVLQPLAPPTNAQRETTHRGEDVFFGNVHIHTDLSVCRRDTQQSPDFNYRWAMDLMQQDFTGLTDHAEGMSPWEWKLNRLLAEFYNFPGRHVTLLSYEWAAPTATEHGHVNVHFRTAAGPLVAATDATGPPLPTLWETLTDGEALTIPHHTATHPFCRSWDVHDERFERLVEVFQDRRGNYEYRDAPAAPGKGVPEQGIEHVVDGHFVADALNRGRRLGLCSGGDHMGLSMTGVLAERLDREAVFQALRTRRCYGVTGAKIRAELRVTCERAVVGMGASLSARPEAEVTLEASIDGAAAISEIALLQQGSVSVRETAGARSAHETFELRAPAAGQTTYAYIRVRQVDGQMAWLSPIWIEGEAD